MKVITIVSKKYGVHEVLVDNEDFERVNRFKWHVHKDKDLGFYAIRNLPAILSRTGKRTSIKMHRFIMSVTSENVVVDHVNHNRLDNQKHNLRICSENENRKNTTSRVKSTSRYLGVSIKNDTIELKSGKVVTYRKIVAQIMDNRKKKHIGYFKTEEEAAKAYDEAAKKYHGEFANLNFK